MDIHIVEIHPGADKKKLNTEWFVVENRGDKAFSTRNCTLSVRKGKGKPRALGTIDPGFSLGPGERMRVLTGTPGKKSQGQPPDDGQPSYSLFLGAPILMGPGTVLSIALRTHAVCSATFDPKAERGVRG